jgi:hypothetical protein
MSRITSIIPAKPRSDRFKYYSAGASSSSGSGGSVTVQPAPEEQQEIAYIDTYDSIPTPPENGLKLVITQDTHEIYSWDEDNQVWVNTTPESDVTKIIAGTNISVSPTSGLGDVTISSKGGVSSIKAGTNVSISPTTGLGDVTINAAGGGVSKIVAGTNVSISPTTGVGDVMISSSFPYIQYTTDNTDNFDILTD